MKETVTKINRKFAKQKPEYDLRYYEPERYNKKPIWQFAKRLSFTDIKYVYLTVYSEQDAVKEVKRILDEC